MRRRSLHYVDHSINVSLSTSPLSLWIVGIANELHFASQFRVPRFGIFCQNVRSQLVCLELTPVYSAYVPCCVFSKLRMKGIALMLIETHATGTGGWDTTHHLIQGFYL